jgi:hypothetical protein
MEPEAPPFLGLDWAHREWSSRLAFLKARYRSQGRCDPPTLPLPAETAPLFRLATTRRQPQYPSARHGPQEHRARDLGRLPVRPQPPEPVAQLTSDLTLRPRGLEIDSSLNPCDFLSPEDRPSILVRTFVPYRKTASLSHGSASRRMPAVLLRSNCGRCERHTGARFPSLSTHTDLVPVFTSASPWSEGWKIESAGGAVPVRWRSQRRVFVAASRLSLRRNVPLASRSTSPLRKRRGDWG